RACARERVWVLVSLPHAAGADVVEDLVAGAQDGALREHRLCRRAPPRQRLLVVHRRASRLPRQLRVPFPKRMVMRWLTCVGASIVIPFNSSAADPLPGPRGLRSHG